MLRYTRGQCVLGTHGPEWKHHCIGWEYTRVAVHTSVPSKTCGTLWLLDTQGMVICVVLGVWVCACVDVLPFFPFLLLALDVFLPLRVQQSQASFSSHEMFWGKGKMNHSQSARFLVWFCCWSSWTPGVPAGSPSCGGHVKVDSLEYKPTQLAHSL